MERVVSMAIPLFTTGSGAPLYGGTRETAAERLSNAGTSAKFSELLDRYLASEDALRLKDSIRAKYIGDDADFDGLVEVRLSSSEDAGTHVWVPVGWVHRQ